MMITTQHLKSSSNIENLRTLINKYGPGPAEAIKYGIDNAFGVQCVYLWAMVVTTLIKLKNYSH